VSRRLRAIAANTVAIVEQGHYLTYGGDRVELADAVARAVAGTRLHLPDEPLPEPAHRNASPRIEVTNESTLSAAGRLGGDVAGLVFASARNPGGGFLTGARAQEEDIARASALHACLLTVGEFYAHHRADRDLRYTDRVIHASEPNLRAIRDNQPDLAATVPVVVRRRCERVVRVAAAHGHRRLVLGAWGCGVFGNDPTVVAEAFAAALSEVPAFDHVAFAVLDRAPDTATFRAFAEVFA
jgi:hypothetical protein